MELDQFRDVDLVIDRANDSFVQKQFVSQGDYKGRTLTVQVTNNGSVGEVPGLTLNLNWHNEASGLTDLTAFAIVSKTSSIFKIEYPEHMMTPGKVLASIQVIQNGKVINLKEFELTVQSLAGQPVGIVQKAEFSALVAVLADSNRFRTDIDTLGIAKVDRSGVGQVSWANISQEAREQFIGEVPPAVVGIDSVLTENIVDKAVTGSKTSFLKVGENLFNIENVVYDKFVQLDGAIRNSTDYVYIPSIPISEGQSLTLSLDGALQSKRFVTAYDSNGNVLPDKGVASSALPYTAPSGVASVIVSLHKNVFNERLMLSYGSSPLPYSAPLKMSDIIEFGDLQINRIKEIAQEEANSTQGSGDVRISILNNGFSVRSMLESDEITVSGSLVGSSNGTLSFYSTSLNSQVVHSITDDITPMRLWTTVGANHGYTSAANVTLANHGKTNADLGSVWTDGSENYILVKVSGNILTFIKDYLLDNQGAVYSSSISFANNLTHVSGATNTAQVSTSTAASVQLYPSVNKKTNRVLVNGKEVAKTGTYYGDNITIIEQYNIMDYKKIVDWAKANIGKSIENDDIGGAVKITIAYVFTQGCKCLVSHSAEFLSKQIIQNNGFLQAASLNSGAKRYVPDLKNTIYDWGNGVVLSSATQTEVITSDKLDDVSFPPSRTYEVYNGLVFNLGYLFDKFDASPDFRLANSTRYWDLRNTGKNYPIVMDNKKGYADVGEYISVAGYRVYGKVANLPSTLLNSFYVEDAESYYLFVDSKESISRISVSFKGNIGMPVQLIQSKNCSLLELFTNVDGVLLSFSNKGSAVLKIRKI
ncbi:hypothetical protein [Enterococcus sp. AZ012]|uniref:hypothetical protein n=1 Tax=unclassified Enterococcus TaxID=2608891 RepID=UPI003D2CB718